METDHATLFVAHSSFTVANGMTDEVKAAFRNRPRHVETAPGFVRMDVISPLASPDEIWLITYWEDEASYRTWHGSEDHHDAHAEIPRGLKLVPGSAQVRFFEHVCS